MVEGIELTLKSMLDVVRKFGVEVIAETNVPLDRMCIRLSQWWNLMTLRQVTYWALCRRVIADGSYDSCGDGNCSESKSVISVS